MSWQRVLRGYATNPDNLPSSVLFSKTATTVTIFDSYPKAIFHFLILPRPTQQHTANDLANLRKLLRKDRQSARVVLDDMKDQSNILVKDIQNEMRSRYGFIWDIWTGFHATPSVPHLHLHVISSDLVSPALKNKKHYNSFRPSLGFFLELDTVLSWFDDAPEAFKQHSSLRESQYEPLLKEDLVCFRCNHPFKSVPLLKSHLQEEWDTMRKRSLKKREAEEIESVDERPLKRPAKDKGEISSALSD